jgi:hypothetical protein
MKSFSPVTLALFAAVGMVTAADMSTSDCAVSGAHPDMVD